ncbi:uncharacterized protein LOC125493810 [Beta vulgaris subsp. vulgaris]|uniref:uncharacterized protein LOC125493810 n=1 Tax=Beta vulgaris subsp. vulgaris TaxID=3555 RepID=UPI0020374C31|nr:uncharacterized protein LOC125493810 [Beta vulgaris subsp. vulgaris]
MISRAVGVQAEYSNAVEKATGGQAPERGWNLKWQAPGAGRLKLNTDAAFRENDKLGMGAVLRDECGDVLVAVCNSWHGRCEVEVGEAMAVREGIRVAMEAGFHGFIVETDCMTLFEALKRKRRPASVLGRILQDIYVLISSCTNVTFSFVRRSGNEVAHLLAKRSLESDELLVWLEEAPEFVMPSVALDVSG